MIVRHWLAVACLLVLGALTMAACGSSDKNDNADSSSSKKSSGGSSSKSDGGSGGSDCGTKATDDCTPHVGPNGKVRVDALVWRVVKAETTKTLGDQTYGLGAKADGTFVVLTLKVTSKKNESATLTDDVIQLEGPGRTYKPDNDGTSAAIGAGEDPLFLTDLGPDQTTTSRVVFDVPRRFLKQTPEVRFNELGFGSTHAYIELPQTVARL